MVNYLLKIELLFIKPQIWRHFVVPGEITLDCLHDVIQIVMGWENKHLYQFRIMETKYIDEREEDKESNLLITKDYRLCDLIKNNDDTFEYLYDFGDYWEHLITVEDAQYSKKNLKSNIICLEGAMACPMEDIGGALGYMDYCKAIKNSRDKEHEYYMEWVGDDYDSEVFDFGDINLKLEKYRHRSKR